MALALLGVSCGGSPEQSAARESAETAIDNLQASNDVRDFEVLNVDSGAATTLREVVDGDKPVLLWFYAPH